MLFDPLAQTIAAYDKFSVSYSDQWFRSEVVHDFFDRFASMLEKTAIVLDAGCGSGREINELNVRGIDCVGIDLSYNTIKRARTNVKSGFFRVMDIRSLEYPDSLFDGVICIAVVHHLFERDFAKTLIQFQRVTKPKGIIALTIRLGDGYMTDSLGRVTILRSQRSVEDIVNSLGFSINHSKVSIGHDDTEWLQIILVNVTKEDSAAAPFCAFCRTSLFLKENRAAGSPVAASVLWGDDKYIVTLDVAPVIKGHLLIATNKHVLSTLGTGQDLARLSFHKTQVDHVLKRAFKRKPIFLEHGSVQQNRDPCIEHAHVHAVPVRGELRMPLQRRLGRLSTYRSLARADEGVRELEYIAYENKRGQIYIKCEGVADLPSQFLRMIVSESIGVPEYRWVPCRDDVQTRNMFNETLRRLVDILDAEVLSREIVSDIPQEIRYRLSRIDHQQRREVALSKTGHLVVSRLSNYRPEISIGDLKLDDIGESNIVERIIVPYFDAGHRGATYIGDDAAVFPWSGGQIVATSDHCPRPLFFSLGIESYEAYGWLSVVISLSDIAAMGGEPRAILLNTEMPPSMRAIDYVSFMEGASFAANTYGARVIGGNIRESNQFAASTTVLGGVGPGGELRRDGAEPGHALFIAGEMGLFWAGVFERYHNLLLPLKIHNDLEAGLLFPEPKLAAAQLLAASGAAGACMDASDGPTQAIQSLARASGCDLIVDIDLMSPSEPIILVAKYLEIDPIALMFTWGNFDLVFTANEGKLFRSIGSDLVNHKIKKVGYVRSGKGRAFTISGGKRRELPRLSVDQFSGARPPSIPEYEDLLRTVKL